MVTSVGMRRKRAAIGRHMEAMIDAKETRPVERKHVSHKMVIQTRSQTNRSIRMEKAINAPRVVATPLPPLNPKKQVQLWPETTVIAARHR